jgi:hypothetical protein
MEKKKWFVRKKYGWGWTPASWQGWLLIALYILFVLGSVQNIVLKGAFPELVWTIFVTALLCWITRVRGDGKNCDCAGAKNMCCNGQNCKCDNTKKEG